MSTPPNRSAVAITTVRTPSALFRSAGMASTSAPVSSRIWPAVACRSASVREQIVTRAPSRARASADALPRPLLDAPTSATLPFSPRSTRFPNPVHRPCEGHTDPNAQAAAPVRWRGGNSGDRAQRRLQLGKVRDRPVPAGGPAGSMAGLGGGHADPGAAGSLADVGHGYRVRRGRRNRRGAGVSRTGGGVDGG